MNGLFCLQNLYIYIVYVKVHEISYEMYYSVASYIIKELAVKTGF